MPYGAVITNDAGHKPLAGLHEAFDLKSQLRLTWAALEILHYTGWSRDLQHGGQADAEVAKGSGADLHPCPRRARQLGAGQLAVHSELERRAVAHKGMAGLEASEPVVHVELVPGMHIGPHLAYRRAPRSVAARRSRQPKPQVQVFGVVQPIDQPELEEFDEVDLAGRHKPGEPTRQVAAVPGEVREPDQRVRLRMDAAEGDVVEIISGGVANHGLKVQPNNVPKG